MLWRDYFSFTRGEKKGILLLLIIILSLLIINKYLKETEANPPVDFSEFEAEIEAFENDIADLSPHPNYKSLKKQTPQLFEFNPNTSEYKALQKLGMTSSLANTIINYRKKGGRFYRKEDLKKIYGLNDSIYDRLEPFILLARNTEHTKQAFTPKTKTALPLITINTADTSDLKQLKGIGSTFALRIVKYRNLLGGFVKKEQLKEVYGLPLETYQQIKNQITINTSNITKIDINETKVDQLKKHPYINWKVANAIVKYRQAHGNYQELEDLNNIHLLDTAAISKISPYLKVSE